MASSCPLDFTTIDETHTLDEAKLEDDFAASSTVVEVTVSGLNKTLKIHTEEVNKNDGKESKPEILFLHGMRFSSKNWLDIRSLYHAANWGFRAVAVDLPGFGKSVNATVAAEHNAEFLASLIEALKLSRLVIVSPSMSGGFSLPYLFQSGSSSTEKVIGYVPVAPVGTSKFVEEYKKSQLPTLIVYGTKDAVIGETSKRDFGNLPKGQYAPIEGAGHACYLDNPEAFHKLLYHFLSKLV